MTIGDGTTIRAATEAEAIDLSIPTIVAYFSGGKYAAAIVALFAHALLAVCRLTLIRASILAGQIANETGRFTFTGAVRPEQYNLAGLAATDDGAAGLSFGTIGEGVSAVAAHHGGYLFGPAERWPAPWRELLPLAVRLPVVLRAGYGGTVAALGGYGAGRWATDPDYAAKVARHANALLELQGKQGGAMEPRIIDIRGELPTRKGGGSGTKYAAKKGQVLHYSAVNYPKTRPILDILMAEARYHIRTVSTDGNPPLKEAGLAYHQAVDPITGDIYLTRDEDDVLWHCGYWGTPGNRDGLAIHVPGGSNLVMTDVAVQSLLWLLRRNEEQYGFGRAMMKGHKELSATTCPGPLMPQIVLPYRAGELVLDEQAAAQYRDPLTGHYLHPELADSYDPAKHGEILQGAALYSDGKIRQMFKYAILSVGQDGKPDLTEGIGQALLFMGGGRYPEWPDVKPLV
jgi:hypothetical protein